MPISLQKFSGWLIRAGEEHEKVGDPYRVSAVAEMSGDTATVMGLDRRISKGEFKDTLAALASRGANRVKFERRKGGKIEWKEYRMKEPISVEISVKDADGHIVFECAWRQMEKKNLEELECALMGGVMSLGKNKPSKL